MKSATLLPAIALVLTYLSTPAALAQSNTWTAGEWYGTVAYSDPADPANSDSYSCHLALAKTCTSIFVTDVDGCLYTDDYVDRYIVNADGTLTHNGVPAGHVTEHGIQIFQENSRAGVVTGHWEINYTVATDGRLTLAGTYQNRDTNQQMVVTEILQGELAADGKSDVKKHTKSKR